MLRSNRTSFCDHGRETLDVVKVGGVRARDGHTSGTSTSATGGCTREEEVVCGVMLNHSEKNIGQVVYLPLGGLLKVPVNFLHNFFVKIEDLHDSQWGVHTPNAMKAEFRRFEICKGLTMESTELMMGLYCCGKSEYIV